MSLPTASNETQSLRPLRDTDFAAKFLDVSKDQIIRLRRRGELRAVKCGALVRFFEEDLVAYARRKIETLESRNEICQKIRRQRAARKKKVA